MIHNPGCTYGLTWSTSAVCASGGAHPTTVTVGEVDWAATPQKVASTASTVGVQSARAQPAAATACQPAFQKKKREREREALTLPLALAQVDVMPFLGRTPEGGPFDAYYEALSDLGAMYVRYAPWCECLHQ